MLVKTIQKNLKVYGKRQLKQVLYTCFNYATITLKEANCGRLFNTKIQEYLKENTNFKYTAKELVIFRMITRIFINLIFWSNYNILENLLDNFFIDYRILNKYSDLNFIEAINQYSKDYRL